jgi:hypothetical protein
MGAQSGSAKLTMAQSRSSIETYYVSTLERPELPTKNAEPWWPLRFADAATAYLHHPQVTFQLLHSRISYAIRGERH